MYQAILSGVALDKPMNSQPSPGVTNEEIEKLILDDDDEGFVTDDEADTDSNEDGSGNIEETLDQ